MSEERQPTFKKLEGGRAMVARFAASDHAAACDEAKRIQGAPPEGYAWVRTKLKRQWRKGRRTFGEVFFTLMEPEDGQESNP